MISKLLKGELSYEHSLEAAVKMSLNIVRNNARRILKNEVYDKPGADDHQRHLSGRLYKNLRVKVLEIGKGVAAGDLTSKDPEAVWLESGTRPHEVAAVNAEVMHWIGIDGDAFSKRHEIAGVTAIHFMRDALAVSRDEILEIFQTVFGQGGFYEGGVDYLNLGSDILFDEEDEISQAF